jgi:hypothetical protein
VALASATDLHRAIGPATALTYPEAFDLTDSHAAAMQIDPLEHDVVDFEALLEGGLAEGFIDRLRQVQARVDDGAHGGPAGACINPYHS